jgi:hypothetical protein
MADHADEALEAAVNTEGDYERDPDLPPTVADIPPRPKDKKKDTKPPRSKASLAQSKSKELKKIRGGLEGILSAPAFVISEEWPKGHIEAQAPNLTNAIIAKAESDDEFRKKLSAFLAAGDGAGLFLAAVMYVAPLAIYYGVPAPPGAKKMLQIPDRPLKINQEEVFEQNLPEETIVAEAAEHGYESVEEYKQAVRQAVAAKPPGAVLRDE